MIPVRWLPRDPPLAPVGVAARGDAAARLADRVLADPSRWRGVAGDGVLVLLGDDLPWVDGVVYLGRDPEAPALLHPTTRRPDAPLALVAEAFLAGIDGPAALLLDPPLLVPVGAARPVDPGLLAAWRDR